MTRKTQNALARSSSGSSKVELPPHLSSSTRLAEILASDEFLEEWHNDPAHDIAENILRLRRLRGITQDELAIRVGTKQPAIARIESGRANIGVKLLKKIAAALKAAARVEITPLELIEEETSFPPWWDRVDTAPGTPVVYVFGVANTTVTIITNNFYLGREEAEIVKDVPRRVEDFGGTMISAIPMKYLEAHEPKTKA